MTLMISRPSTLETTDFIGQDKLRAQLVMLLDSATRRDEQPGHILLTGAAGLGKTSLAAIVAHRLGATLHTTSAGACSTKRDMVRVLSALSAGDVLFIEEIHGLPRKVEELLYTALEDGSISVAGDAGTITVTIAPFTLVGATTMVSKLSKPLRDRFDLIGHLSYYSVEELAEIVRRGAESLSVTITDDAATMISLRSRGTPRVALRLLRRARDIANDITVERVC